MEIENNVQLTNLDIKEIGKRIKSIRKLKKMTQKKLSEATKLDPTSISRYETGAQTANLSTLVSIACALDTSLDYLVFGKEHKNESSEQCTQNRKILESIVTLLENEVVSYNQTTLGTNHLNISNHYKSYKEFVITINKIISLDNLIGDQYETIKNSIIEKFLKQLDKEEQEFNDLPF